MGGRSGPEDAQIYEPSFRAGPPLPTALGLGLALFALLLSNGRPIGAGDTRPTEHLAKSLVERGRLDLDLSPEVEPPFARREGAHRVSIYPALSAVVAAPVFALGRVFFPLDETGTALCGKIAASLFSAIAAVFLFLAVARREEEGVAALTAFFFALGTSVWSTSQALWQHPLALLGICAGLFLILKAEEREGAAAFAGLPLSLAVAARHADIVLVLVLSLGVLIRWPRKAPGFVL